MIKRVSIFIMTVLCTGFLFACENKNPFSSEDTAKSSISSKTTSGSELYDDGLDEIANQFLTSVKNKDIKSIVDLGFYDEAACFWVNDIKLDRYDLKRVNSEDFPAKFAVVLYISQSKNDLFPIGTSKWELKIDFDSPGLRVFLFKPVDKMLDIISHDVQDDVVSFCYRFSLELKCYQSLTDFTQLVPDYNNGDDFVNFCTSLIRALKFSTDPEVKRTDLQERVKKAFNMASIDFKRAKSYNDETDTIECTFLGGYWAYCTLSSKRFEAKTSQYTVVIDYYADTAFLIKAKTMEYTVKKNNDNSLRLLSTKLIYDSGFEVATDAL